MLILVMMMMMIVVMMMTIMIIMTILMMMNCFKSTIHRGYSGQLEVCCTVWSIYT